MTNPLEDIKKLWPTIVAVCAIFVAGATTMTLLIDMKTLPDRMVTVEQVNARQEKRIDSLAAISATVAKDISTSLSSIDDRLERLECNINLLAKEERGICQ